MVPPTRIGPLLVAFICLLACSCRTGSSYSLEIDHLTEFPARADSATLHDQLLRLGGQLLDSGRYGIADRWEQRQLCDSLFPHYPELLGGKAWDPGNAIYFPVLYLFSRPKKTMPGSRQIANYSPIPFGEGSSIFLEQHKDARSSLEIATLYSNWDTTHIHGSRASSFYLRKISGFSKACSQEPGTEWDFKDAIALFDRVAASLANNAQLTISNGPVSAGRAFRLNRRGGLWRNQLFEGPYEKALLHAHWTKGDTLAEVFMMPGSPLFNYHYYDSSAGKTGYEISPADLAIFIRVDIVKALFPEDQAVD